MGDLSELSIRGDCLGQHLCGDKELDYGSVHSCGWWADGCVGEKEGVEVQEGDGRQVCKEEVRHDSWLDLRSDYPGEEDKQLREVDEEADHSMRRRDG